MMLTRKPRLVVAMSSTRFDTEELGHVFEPQMLAQEDTRHFPCWPQRAELVTRYTESYPDTTLTVEREVIARRL